MTISNCKLGRLAIVRKYVVAMATAQTSAVNTNSSLRRLKFNRPFCVEQSMLLGPNGCVQGVPAVELLCRVDGPQELPCKYSQHGCEFMECGSASEPQRDQSTVGSWRSQPGSTSRRTAEPPAPMVSARQTSPASFVNNGLRFVNNPWKEFTNRAQPDVSPYLKKMAVSEISQPGPYLDLGSPSCLAFPVVTMLITILQILETGMRTVPSGASALRI